MKYRTKNVATLRIEQTERIAIPKAFTRHCELCGTTRMFVTVEAACVNFGISTRDVFRLVESGAVHCVEDSRGLMFVCAVSIANRGPKADALSD